MSNYNKRKILRHVKEIQINILKNYDYKTANNKDKDCTHNHYIVFFGFLVSLIEILVGIFGFSYICTMLWLILCEFIEDFVLNTDYHWLCIPGEENSPLI